jgi:glycosyltransferase involved in cell wall biosynthesis
LGEDGLKPITVLFVGGFREKTGDGAVGGSLVAARSLVSSGIARHVEWILLDTTMRSVPGPPLPVRVLFAARRVVRFVLSARRDTTDLVLIFAGTNWGFVEKGVMALVAKAMGKPVLFSPRAGPMKDFLRIPVAHAFAREVLSRCDRVICQGDTWTMFYRELTGLPERRVISIPNWVDLADFAFVPRTTQSDRATVILYLGWLERSKGVLDLIHAVDRYRSSLGNAKLILCGGGGAADEARELTRTLGLEDMISFPGWVHGEEKRRLLTSSDILVLPSHSEGMSNAVLEGMACGLAVLATRVGAIPDVVEDGRSGVLVEARDVDALGQALVRLVQDPEERARLGRGARETVARGHDLEGAWKRMLTVMHDALGDRRSRPQG